MENDEVKRILSGLKNNTSKELDLYLALAPGFFKTSQGQLFQL